MLTSSNSTSSSTSSSGSSSSKACSSSSLKSNSKQPRLLLDMSYFLEAAKKKSSQDDEWDRLENNINDWLDEQNIFMVDPRQKQSEFFQTAKNQALEECQKEELRPTSSGFSIGSNSLLLLSPLILTSPLRSDLKLELNLNPSMFERRNKFSFSNLV